MLPLPISHWRTDIAIAPFQKYSAIPYFIHYSNLMLGHRHKIAALLPRISLKIREKLEDSAVLIPQTPSNMPPFQSEELKIKMKQNTTTVKMYKVVKETKWIMP